MEKVNAHWPPCDLATPYGWMTDTRTQHIVMIDDLSQMSFKDDMQLKLYIELYCRKISELFKSAYLICLSHVSNFKSKNFNASCWLEYLSKFVKHYMPRSGATGLVEIWNPASLTVFNINSIFQSLNWIKIKLEF